MNFVRRMIAWLVNKCVCVCVSTAEAHVRHFKNKFYTCWCPKTLGKYRENITGFVL